MTSSERNVQFVESPIILRKQGNAPDLALLVLPASFFSLSSSDVRFGSEFVLYAYDREVDLFLD